MQVSAADLEAITHVSSWGGIDLSLFNTLQDTVSIVSSSLSLALSCSCLWPLPLALLCLLLCLLLSLSPSFCVCVSVSVSVFFSCGSFALFLFPVGDLSGRCFTLHSIDLLTVQLQVFTKQYGFRFSSMPHTYMGPRICVADIDFTSDGPGVLDEPQNFLVQATVSGACLPHQTSMSEQQYVGGRVRDCMSKREYRERVQTTRYSWPRLFCCVP